MRVYFVGSISGRKEHGKNYTKIISSIEKMGHTVYEITTTPTEDFVYHSMTDQDKKDQYKRVLDWINKSDVMVAEGTNPSLGVGYEISQAIERGTPVVLLHSSGNAPHFLEGMDSDKLIILKYDKSNIESVVSDAIDYASEKMDTRFNFFISPKIANYLDWIAKKRRIPRAVYLRRLIEKDMKDRKIEE